jgi:MFS family permease
MPMQRYRVALRAPAVGRLLGTSLIARAPNGMSALAILLLVTRHQGYARAGLVTGVYVAAAGISNPLLSRAVDRIGARPVLAPTAVGYAAAMLGLALAPDRSYLLDLVIGAAAGLSSPPVISVVRGLWPRLLDEEVAQAVYGLEATAQELVFIAGPALVALLAGLFGAPFAVAATGIIGMAGTLAFIATPVFADHVRSATRVRHRLLRTTRLPVYIAVAVSLVLAFNMTDIGVVAFISGRHASAASGVVLALWSLGSMLGGLRFGAAQGLVDDASLARGTAAIAVSIAAAALAPGRVGLGAIMFFGGAAIAPTLGRLYARVGAIAPAGASTEAFAWMGVGMLAGASVGSALGGLTVDALGPRADFLLAAALPALVAATLSVWLRKQPAVVVRRQPLPS